MNSVTLPIIHKILIYTGISFFDVFGLLLVSHNFIITGFVISFNSAKVTIKLYSVIIYYTNLTYVKSTITINSMSLLIAT